MDQSKIQAIIFITFAIVMVLLAGIFVYIFQYRKRKILHLKETHLLTELHQKQLLSTQLETQQQAMQHIGIEIHDNVGQKLTLASLYSKQLINNNSPEVSDKINTIGNIIDEALSELRQLSKTLTNPQLAQADLLLLLREESKRVNASGVCHLSVTSKENEINLPQAKKNITFRLLQEFIQNSLKHAGCKKITIDISVQSNTLSIMAADDGRGFDTTETTTGIGLQNMQRRAEQLNTAFELKSETGKGTTLNLQIAIN